MVVIPGYSITALLYRGSRTLVYRGVRTCDALPVVIKTLQPEWATPENSGRLNHEYEISRDLNLNNIVKTVGLEASHGALALILEDFGGVSLKSRLPADGMGLIEFLKCAVQVARALGELHSCQIVHKDVKPANIIINPSTGMTKITDFGISTNLMQEFQSPLISDAFEGSVSYMSPEQTGRMNRAVDYRTDFYSAGVAFYEMLSGQLPFHAEDQLEWVHCHIARQPSPLQSFNRTIPAALSAVIMKLMAKTAEERYQSAHGLVADLEQCLHQVATGRVIEMFQLGRHDVSRQFHISQKLYGRDSEISSLLDTFERVCKGDSELLLVTGGSGIGKSSFVREIHKQAVKHRGYFISGKFDPFQRDIPYNCLIQAFGELVQQLLTESDEAISLWKKQLTEALDRNGQVIIDVIPEVQRIIGEQPPLPELPAAESQNRFNLVFSRFVGVFARREHPLVIFTDDLHWADTASLKLMQHIISDPDARHVLLIWAYRDGDVNKALPLQNILGEIQSAGTALRTISLGPLGTDDITGLLRESFGNPETLARPLAELLLVKTGGNPYVINEFLKRLYESKLFSIDPVKNCWACDLKKVEQVCIPGDMAELIAGELSSLPEPTRRTLGFGACFGGQFTLAMLSLLLGQSQNETARELWPAIKGGFLVSDGSFHHNVPDEFRSSMTFSFIHDRVQQASYSLMPEQIRRETHIKIGRLLLECATPEERDIRIFDIVNHFDDIRKHSDDPAERRLIAGLNLKAGEKALGSNAYESAIKYFTTGMDLLQDKPWEYDYDLTSALHIKRLECELLCSNYEQAERLFDESLKKLKTDSEKAQVYIIKIVLCANLGRFTEAIQLGAEALRMFRVVLPATPGKTAILLQYLKSRRLRSKRKREGYTTISDLARLPEMSDPGRLAVMGILSNIGAPSYLHDKNLFTLIAMMMVNHSLEYGNSAQSPVAYSLYGMMIIGAFGQFDAGYEFGAMALRLNENSGHVQSGGKTAFVFHNFIAHRMKPLAQGAEALKDVFLDCLRCGDLIYAGYSLLARILHLFAAGSPLETIINEGDRDLEFLQRVQNQDALLFVKVVQQSARCLQGTTGGPASFSDKQYDEELQISLMKAKGTLVPLQGYYLFKCQSLYILGDYEGALKMAIESEKLSNEALCQSYHAEHYLFCSLAITALWHRTSWIKKRRFRLLLNRNLKILAEWARYCPENFRHKELLVAGEIARISGAGQDGIRLFEEAASSAGNGGFLQYEAMACELAANAYLAQQSVVAAKACFLKAYDCYGAWGAKAKLKLLEQRHASWVSPPVTVPTFHDETSRHTTAFSTSSGSEALDMLTVIKVSQSISSEVNLDRLLHLLIGFLIENAGANRGVLILRRDNRLFIEAEGTSDSSISVVLHSLPVDGCGSISSAIVNYVARTLEHLVLDDAASDSKFKHDHYILEKLSKSILCTPIINQGRLIGILYLENNLVAGAFTEQRLRVLELLSSQAAISIENARLYEGLKSASEELEEYSRSLEHKVEERTKALSEEILIRKKAEEAAEEANRIKSDFLSTVSHELRTPLTSVLGFAKIIRKKLDESVLPSLQPEDAKAAKSLGQIRDVTDIIVSEGERLTVLIDDVLDLAKMEAGKITWNVQRISVIEVIERATVAVSSLFEQKKLILEKDIDPALPEISGDRDRLIQVVINLLSNAWKFTNEGSIVVRAAFAESEPGRRFIKIGIADSGIGISPEDQEKIFEKFKQVGDTLTDKPRGTGLGLPICREIVAFHGGSIWVESEAGKGSTFCFTLPADYRIE